MLILLDLQSNSAGLVLINDGTLGAGIREWKSSVVTPPSQISCDTKTKCLYVFSEALNFVMANRMTTNFLNSKNVTAQKT